MTQVGDPPGPDELAAPLIEWFAHAARDLPWRRPGTSPWAVLVSEVMLQQTPVARVRPVYEAWLARWPGPVELAGAPAGDAVRMWGRLGYPRRALRLHRCATIVRDRHGGELPADVEVLLGLPGIGAYTARAVAAFAFGQRVPVVDTNVRRVLARCVSGHGAAGPVATQAELREVALLLPDEPARAVRVSAALMELGALVCTARAPQCSACPLAARCAWLAAGRPDYTGVRAPAQAWAGTDRQVRGLLLGVVRAAAHPVGRPLLDEAWPDAGQRERALASLLADGLLEQLADGTFTLPT